MSIQQITIGSQTYNLVAMPASPAPSAVAFQMIDTVATVVNPFTQRQQTQTWAGGDLWGVQVTMPPMKRADVAAWLAFLAELRGAANVFQIGDPNARQLLGTGAGTPTANSSTYNAPGATQLSTAGWTASAKGVLQAGDYFQLGYRLHMCLDAVDADANGAATFSIFPSVRDTLAAATPLILAKPTGLFRLAANKRTWNSSPSQLTTFSFNAVEAR